jgi:hypothetical protein
VCIREATLRRACSRFTGAHAADRWKGLSENFACRSDTPLSGTGEKWQAWRHASPDRPSTPAALISGLFVEDDFALVLFYSCQRSALFRMLTSRVALASDEWSRTKALARLRMLGRSRTSDTA